MNPNPISKTKKRLLLIMAFAPVILFAQEPKSASSSYFTNPLFLSLLILIILLLIVIVSLSTVLKNVSQSDYLDKKLKEKNQESATTSGGQGKVSGIILACTLLSSQLMAQGVTVHTQKWLIGGLNYWTIFFMTAILVIEAICIVCLLYIINGFVKLGEHKLPKAKPLVKEITLLEALSDAVDIENEHEIMLDHNYDGIKELDNNLPPWWKYGFYLTIVVAFIYMIHYHGAKTGNLQAAEYDNEIAEAKAQIEEYMKTAANNVDETTVKLLDSPSDISAGKNIFLGNCSACHGKLGEGGVGPNFSDDYWLYSGGISDLFKTIKYGKADKGMKSWKEDLSPIQIAQVASYIKTLRGTNPPNPKAPQGDLYTEQISTTDSLKTNTDTLSLKNTRIADTAKVKK